MLQLLLLFVFFFFFVHVFGVQTILNNMNRSVDWWKWQINDVLLLFYNVFLMILWRKINCKHCKRYLMEWHRMHRSDTYLDASSTQKWCFKLVHNIFFFLIWLVAECRLVWLISKLFFFSAIFFMHRFLWALFQLNYMIQSDTKIAPKKTPIF